MLENVTSYYVGDIIAGSPADKADMHEGDRIISLNGRPVTSRPNSDVLHIVRTR